MTDQTLPPCPLDDCGGGEHHYHEWTNQDLECTHAAAQFANFTRCYGPHREPSPLRLPDAETLAREVWGHLTDEVMAQAGKDLVQIAQRYLDALARLVPRWVPVPEEATIPEGVRYRLERANGHNSEWRGTLDRGPSLRSGSNAYFVRSTDLDKLTYPDPDADLKRRIRDAIAASVDSTTHCDGEWDDLAARVIGLVREGGRPMTADTMVDLDALREAIDSDNHPIISLDVTMLSALIRELEAARAAVRRVHDDTPRIIRQVLRNELGYEDAYDAHSWRCHDKRRYPGPCPCADEIARILCHELALLGVSDDE